MKSWAGFTGTNIEHTCSLFAKEGCYAFLPCYLDILALLCSPTGRLALGAGWRKLCCRLGRAPCKRCEQLGEANIAMDLVFTSRTKHDRLLAEVVRQTCTAMHMQLTHQAGRAAPPTLIGLCAALCRSLWLARRGCQGGRPCRCWGSLGTALTWRICILPHLLSHFLALVIVRFAHDFAPLASCRPGLIGLKALAGHCPGRLPTCVVQQVRLQEAHKLGRGCLTAAGHGTWPGQCCAACQLQGGRAKVQRECIAAIGQLQHTSWSW